MGANGNKTTKVPWGLRVAMMLYTDAWRRRYEEEMLTLTEDLYGSSIPLSCYAGMIKEGVRQRLSGMGILAANPLSQDPGLRIRQGATLTIWGFAFTVLGGLGFAKFIEHWIASISELNSTIPGVGVRMADVAAALGAAIVLGGLAVLAVPTVSFLKGGGWPAVRRKFVTTLSLAGATAAWLVLMVGRAHSMTSAQRNGGSVLYLGLGLAFVALIFATTFSLASLVASVTRAVETSDMQTKACGWLSVLLGADVVLLVAGVVTWWASMAIRAPWFFGGTRVHPDAGAPSPLLVSIGALLAASLVFVIVGAWKSVPSLIRSRAKDAVC